MITPFEQKEIERLLEKQEVALAVDVGPAIARLRAAYPDATGRIRVNFHPDGTIDFDAVMDDPFTLVSAPTALKAVEALMRQIGDQNARKLARIRELRTELELLEKLTP